MNYKSCTRCGCWKRFSIYHLKLSCSILKPSTNFVLAAETLPVATFVAPHLTLPDFFYYFRMIHELSPSTLLYASCNVRSISRVQLLLMGDHIIIGHLDLALFFLWGWSVRIIHGKFKSHKTICIPLLLLGMPLAA